MQDGILLLMSTFFHFLMPLTTVITCWALSAANMWINLPLSTVSELILCSQRTETAALLLCCSHCTSCVEAMLTPIYTIAVTEGAEKEPGLSVIFSRKRLYKEAVSGMGRWKMEKKVRLQKQQ